jgi:outer membrane protein assembly factor BamB
VLFRSLTAKPLVIGQSIIVADLTKGNKTIKKIDLNTGNVIWTSEKLSSGDGVPVIHVNNNQLICQVGGIIERQEYLAGMGANSSSVCKAFAYLTDDNDLLVLDIETGKTIWNAEKHFKQYKDKFKHLALSKLVNNELVVVTDKNALLLDANSGVLKKSLSIEDMNIGELKYAFNMPGQDIFLYGEEGVARITTQVEKKYAVNTKKNLDVKIEREGIIRVCTDKSGSGTFNKFVLINSVTGEVYGQAEDMPYPYFDADMTSFIDFDGRSTIRKFVFRNK